MPFRRRIRVENGTDGFPGATKSFWAAPLPKNLDEEEAKALADVISRALPERCNVASAEIFPVKEKT